MILIASANKPHIGAAFSALQSLDTLCSSERARSQTGYHGYHVDKAAVKHQRCGWIARSLAKHCFLPPPCKYSLCESTGTSSSQRVRSNTWPRVKSLKPGITAVPFVTSKRGPIILFNANFLIIGAGAETFSAVIMKSST